MGAVVEAQKPAGSSSGRQHEWKCTRGLYKIQVDGYGPRQQQQRRVGALGRNTKRKRGALTCFGGCTGGRLLLFRVVGDTDTEWIVNEWMFGYSTILMVGWWWVVCTERRPTKTRDSELGSVELICAHCWICMEFPRNDDGKWLIWMMMIILCVFVRGRKV